jgi:hypothetical protein
LFRDGDFERADLLPTVCVGFTQRYNNTQWGGNSEKVTIMEYLHDQFSQFLFTIILSILGIIVSLPGVIASLLSFTQPGGDKQTKEITIVAIHKQSIASPRLTQKINTIRTKASKTGTYVAVLITTASPIPMIAALISLMLYVLPLNFSRPGVQAALGGTFLTLIIWLLSIMPFRHFASVDRVSPTTFGLFLKHLYQAETQLTLSSHKKLFKDPLSPYNLQLLSMNWSSKWSSSEKPLAILDEEPKLKNDRVRKVRTSLDEVYELLLQKSRSWILGVGYVNVWELLHRIDEALIDIKTTEQVIADALDAELRLEGSKIDNKDDLLSQLRAATKILTEFTAQQSQSNISQGSQRSASVPDAKMTQTLARTTVSKIRNILHQFSDARLEILVRVRNQFWISGIVTALSVYVLLEIALFIEVRPTVLIGAAVLYLIGATVGLFSYLYASFRDPQHSIPTVADFSLTAPRLLVTPMLSGI